MRTRTPLPLFLLFGTALLSCQREPALAPGSDGQGPVLMEKADITAVPEGEPLSQEQLDRAVIDVLEARNDFQWEWMDIRTLWSATLYNDHSVAIGYQPANAGTIDDGIHKIDVRSAPSRPYTMR
ncbi:MAG: hypothetical protein IPG69_00370 [Flavobacteriales bacterium]|nr:hypothetical protein [Flavobacteriales bacterium]